MIAWMGRGEGKKEERELHAIFFLNMNAEFGRVEWGS